MWNILFVIAVATPTLNVAEPLTEAVKSNYEWLWDLAKVLSGGVGGVIITLCVTYYKNRIQKLECYYTDDDVKSHLPTTLEDGSGATNYHYKEFQLKNTTNRDISAIKVIFEFDASSKIIKKNTLCKLGVDGTKFSKSKKLNEAIVHIKNFNRKDCVTVKFDITDITTHHCNIVEAEITGVKIAYSDKRKPKERSTIQFVTKDKIK